VSEDDFWRRPQSSVRDDVVKALAPRERTCPRCGHVEASASPTCSRCGADLVARAPRARPPRLRPARLTLLILAALAIGTGLGIAISAMRDDASRERAADEARDRERVAAEMRRLVADVRPHRAQGPRLAAGEDPLEHRAQLVATAERLVTRDARGRVRAGTMRGPIAGTDCRPYPTTVGRREDEEDPATKRGRYDCTAYTGHFATPELEGEQRTGITGQPYWVVIDYARATLTWCKVTPRAGEGGAVLASVPVPPPCRDPNR
jgi:hypothetical protein